MSYRRFQFQTLLLTGCALCAFLAAAPLRAADEVSAETDAAGSDLGQVIIESTSLKPKLQAIQQERKSAIVEDILPEDEIRRLPDVNLAEALQRIPGVSLETDSGQGRFINIRGMDTDLNGTYFDGVHLTASGNSQPLGGGRGVAMDVFPSAIVGGVEIIKTLTPDMDAEGVGGQVNMMSHSLPVGGASFLQAELGSGYEPLRNTPVYVGNITAGISFGAGQAPTLFGASADNSGSRPFRLIVNYDYDEDQRGLDDVEESYSNPDGGKYLPLSELDPRWYRYHRVRQGATAELDYDPDPTTGFFIKGLQSGYWESVEKHELLLKNLDGTYTDNGGGPFSVVKAKATQYFVDEAEQVQTSLITAGGHFMLGDRVKVDMQGGWTKGIDNQPHEWEIKFNNINKFNLNYDIADPSNRTYSVTTPGVSLTDPTQFALNGIADKSALNFDQEYSARINIAVAADLLGAEGEVKFGGAVRLRNNGVDNWENDANLPTIAPLMSAFVVPGGNQIFYNNSYNVGPAINRQAAAGSVVSYSANSDTTNQAFSRDTENVYAGYAQYGLKFDDFSVVGGIRVEATKATQLANLQNADTDSYTPITTRENYTNLFPSLQGKYQATPDLQLRAAFSTGIARPGFQQNTASTVVSDDSGTVTTGNANLKPMTADNVDVGASYDLPGGGAAGLGLFYKNFANYIIATGYEAPYQSQGDYLYTTFANIANAHADGVELSIFKPFTFLPKPFDGLGISANYTFVDSSAQLRPGEKTERMPSTSPENVNVALSYDRDPLSIRVAVAYESSNLFQLGPTRDTDIFSAPRIRLDLGASYQLTEHLQIYFDAKNLTDTKLEFTQGTSSANPLQREFYDATYYAGVRARF